MNGQNTVKLLNAGFRVFRIHLANKMITECSDFGKWKKFGSYKTLAELKRAWDELMKKPKNVGD